MRKTYNLWWVRCVLAAFVLTKAATPVGFMPGNALSGMPLVLCKGDPFSARIIVLASQFQQSHHEHHHGHVHDSSKHAIFDLSCDFSVLSVSAFIGADALAQAITLTHQHPYQRLKFDLRVNDTSLLPPARAPPLNSLSLI